MSGISGVCSTMSCAMQGTMKQARANAQEFRTDVKELTQALKTGDLATAQSAYSELQATFDKFKESPAYQRLQASGKADGTLASDFSAIGDALAAGDMTAAQTAAQQMQQDMQAQAQAMQKKMYMAYASQMLATEQAVNPVLVTSA